MFPLTLAPYITSSRPDEIVETVEIYIDSLRNVQIIYWLSRAAIAVLLTTTMVVEPVEIAFRGDVFAVAFTDESQVVGGYHNGDIHQWKIEDRQQQCPIMKASGSVLSIVVSQDGRWIVSGDDGWKVIIWNAATHEKVRELTEHEDQVYAVDISSDSTKIASADKINARIFSATSGDRLLPPLPHDNVCDVKFSPDGSRFATASWLPLVRMSDETLKSWTQDYPTNTEMLLSEEITSASSPSHYVLANRALVRARLKHLAPAIEDAKESLQVQPSPVGHIAMAVALLGEGNREGALCAFDLAFHDCELHDIRFLLLLKLILVFESGNQQEAITRMEYLATRADDGNDNDAIYLYTWARASCRADVLGVTYVKTGHYGRAIPLIERAKKLAPRDKQWLPLETISLKIFGWSFNGLDIVARQRQCESLCADGRTAEAVEIIRNILMASDGETLGSRETVDWVSDFSNKCDMTPEHVVDEAFGSAKLDARLVQYSDMLPLSPPSTASLLIKRSRARATAGKWDNALQDANDAVKADPSYPWGYEAKCVALHGAKRYDEAIKTFKLMLHVIEQSRDPAIKRMYLLYDTMRKNYISPDETLARINSTVVEILKSCPLVVIDVNTGRLCDDSEWKHVFEASSTFADLVLSMTKELDNERIRREIAVFFRYVMLSHVWQGKEPLFQDVECVWDLPDTASNKKLRDFCKETRRLGYNWAWSDTCCIDQNTSTILNQSLTSMYKWYADSAATLVFLTGVAHPSKPRDLIRSAWMTRGWTLQELLAPKQSQEIMQELANALKISRGTIATFSPDNLGVRARLRLASTRQVKRKEDVAYSFIGIFNSDIRPHYGEGVDDALGHLLEEIVARSGEDTVLAWSGKSSSYNSCLPASISVYNQTPYSPPSLEGEEMNMCVTKLRKKVLKPEGLRVYQRINSLEAASFTTRRLRLPCIVFPVRELTMQEICGSSEKLYHTEVSGLGNVEFTTTDDLPLDKPQRFVFAHPWISYIKGWISGATWGDDSESDVDSDSDLDYNTGSDGVASLHVVPAHPVGRYTQSLQMIARLAQPFNALLLARQPNGEYKRVAADHEIVVSGLGTDITPKNIRAKVLKIR
ncbi:hypothetical protein EDC04DRAFT_2916171 [Pisolithus marmoratus]|nr:hypothetical protein EDC04DRAFT_2916171 [Pisolithus marmoratus]